MQLAFSWKGKRTMASIVNRVQLFAIPWTVAHQAPLSMEFFKQEYQAGLPFPPPGDLPYPGLNPGLPHCRQILYHLSPQGSPQRNNPTSKQITKIISDNDRFMMMINEGHGIDKPRGGERKDSRMWYWSEISKDEQESTVERFRQRVCSRGTIKKRALRWEHAWLIQETFMNSITRVF